MEAWGCETTGTPTFGSTNQWRVTSGNIDFVSVPTYWTFLSTPGGYVIDLSGSTPGSIATTINGLTPGSIYTLSFSYTYNPDASVSENRSARLDITNAGGFTTILGPMANVTNALYGTANDGAGAALQQASFNFAPTAGSVTLSFTSLTNRYQGIVLANDIQVSQTPEPATLAVMGFGLVILGLKRFRRS